MGEKPERNGISKLHANGATNGEFADGGRNKAKKWVEGQNGDATYVRRVQGGNVQRAVNADGNFAGRRTEFLIEPAVRSDPHVVFGYSHLRIKFPPS